MGLFGKKQSESPHLHSDRYAGKPLLILLENYILDCIGCFRRRKPRRYRWRYNVYTAEMKTGEQR
jgi:hypothetical protein